MQLLDSWKRSVEFFERKNLSVFGLVTLKSIQTTYSQIFRYLLVPIIFVLGVDMAALYFKISFMQSQAWQVIIWALRIAFLNLCISLPCGLQFYVKIGIIIDHIGDIAYI